MSGQGEQGQSSSDAGCAPSAGSEAGHRTGTFVSLPTFLIMGDILKADPKAVEGIPLPERN